ncbi:hypothetical protein A3Q56_00936 [Intoshia linei]|uniref:Uncharacterized protein n=1 Tax=Intoshia linei TaxID=1819745 RepID=A0A177BCP6_9BILA|nr:hypothetical protein A3Q56_00936 [Intoshia linei]
MQNFNKSIILFIVLITLIHNNLAFSIPDPCTIVSVKTYCTNVGPVTCTWHNDTSTCSDAMSIGIPIGLIFTVVIGILFN